jgi:hypothetical protein
MRADTFRLSAQRTAAVPVLGQASQGISAGLAGLSTTLGGAGAAARNTIRGLGVTGLDSGFGAGLMLKPSAAQQLLTAGSQLVGEWGQQMGFVACKGCHST